MPVQPDNGFYHWRGKLPHVHSPGHAYLLTTTIAKDVPILTYAERTVVLRACLHWHERGWQHYAAVVMPTHLHLVTIAEMQAHGNVNAAALMGSIKSFAARKVNKMRGRRGKLWLREYYDVTLSDEKALRDAVEYVLNNPVKAGLGDTPEDYPWLWTYWSGSSVFKNEGN